MSARVVGFAVASGGSRSFAVTVNGLRVLVTAEEGHHDAGRALAEAISALGPEGVEAPALPPAPAAKPGYVAKKRDFRAGQRVWCNVTAIRKWCVVTEVGTGRNSGRIKINGERGWCPAHNFDERAPGEQAVSP